MAKPEEPENPDVVSEVGRQALVAAGTALAAGLASLTFVAIVGGAVLMARLRGAGLPTEAGVAVQPRSVLLAIGGEVLAPAIAVALVTVFAVHFVPGIHRVIPPPRTAGSADSLRQVRHNVLAALVALFALTYYLLWSAGALKLPLQAGIFVLMSVLACLVGYVSGRLAATAVRARDARRSEALDAIATTQRRERTRLVRVEVTYLAGVAAVIMLFATIAAVTASLADPKVRPAAVLFADGRGPLCGIYVAQNDDHVYIGEAVEDPHIRNVGLHREGRMIDLPRESVRALVLGSGQSLSDAHAATHKLLDELLAVHRVPGRLAVDCGS